MVDDAGQTKRQTKKLPVKAKLRGRPKKARGAANTSDAPSARWTVRGVPDNVRKIAIEAAENRGMTVGDWLAEVIALSAKKSITADGKTNLPAMPQPDLIDLVQNMNDRLTKMEVEKQKGGVLSRFFGNG
jgi:hypothetical protein|tara:strand:- start:62 stop:451 length:390 start_codon:yes stop_codon:yes gene_type:complete